MISEDQNFKPQEKLREKEYPMNLLKKVLIVKVLNQIAEQNQRVKVGLVEVAGEEEIAQIFQAQ
ncbi:MAG: hypothetical protein KKE50_00580 [Nanoarchaeota archaeon]|nr:hypothetical protein [Nanoarchaeota archaeon]